MLKLLVSPDKFFAKIFSKTDFWRFNHPVFLLASGLMAFRSWVKDIHDESEIGLSIVLLFLIFFVGWLVYAYLIPLMHSLAGKILKGKANFQQVQSVTAAGFVPLILTEVFELIFLFLTKDYFFEQSAPYVIGFVFGIVNIRIMTIGLSKVNQFSYGFALLVLFLAYGFIFGLYFVVTK